MRPNWKYLYYPSQAPPFQISVAYLDPVFTENDREEIALRLSKQSAVLRRASLGERGMVITAAALLALVMLPVVLVVVAGFAAEALWRRFRNRERAR